MLNEDFKNRFFECVARTYKKPFGVEPPSAPTSKIISFDIRTSPFHTTHAGLIYELDKTLMTLVIPLAFYDSDPKYCEVRIDDPKVKTFMDSLESGTNYTDFGKVVNWKWKNNRW